MSKNAAIAGAPGFPTVALRVLLVGSLALNAFLAMWLLGPLTRNEGSGKAFGSPAQWLNPASRSAALTEAGTKKRANLAGGSRAAFGWQEVESADYRQYVANLRAIGCPEQTVRDILMADLNQSYAARAHAIWAGPGIREFWQKGLPQQERDPETTERLKALAKEKMSVVDQIIGAHVPSHELAQALLMTPNGARTDLAFLPDEKREAAYRALCDANLASASGIYRLDNNGKQRPPDAEIAVLSAILSPDELEEYQMRTSPVANWLRTEISYFDCSPDEFRTLVKMREETQGSTNVSNDAYARMAEDAKAFGRLFGEDRGKEYLEKADLFYLWARQAAERFSLPENAADRAWEIKHDAIDAMRQLHANATLTKEQRRHQLEELHNATEGRLVQILGVKGTAMASRGDWWLQYPTMNYGP